MSQGESSANTTFLIGTGIYDVTGPAAERGMMGYAMLRQRTSGIHMRLRSRAFVIASPRTGKRVAFVSADLGMIFQAVKQRVVERLGEAFEDLYTADNVILSATHTHSGPGGYSHYTLYNLTTLGFDQQNFDAIVDGIFQSIARAHRNLAPGTVKISTGALLDTSINRSPEAYALNPDSERSLNPHDTDKQMTILKFEKMNGTEIGTINWFAVHGTSMGNDNLLISGDNKGYAAYLFEKEKGTDYLANETFVAAFAQANEGDVTPNIFGGTDGGGANDFESTMVSGSKQFAMARDLYERATKPLTDGVDYRHSHVDFASLPVAPQWADGMTSSRTCTAAIGVSMLAGAEDGRGFGKEGVSCADLAKLGRFGRLGRFGQFWKQFLCDETGTSCQAEKPIILETGRMRPYPWTPELLPLQLVTIGSLAIVAVPFEATTMAGRWLRGAVGERLQAAGIEHVVIAGLSNAYAGYVTTREEYAAQHYEGASTHFGPWTLAALQQEFSRLAIALRDGTGVERGPTPRDLSGKQFNMQPGVWFDARPLFKKLGSVHRDARSHYDRAETVSVTFWGGHPKNDLRIQSTYLEVQREVGSSWVTIARDWDPETKYIWKRHFFAFSLITIEWTIPDDAPAGSYRVRHHGHWKAFWKGKIMPYTGTSQHFAVG